VQHLVPEEGRMNRICGHEKELQAFKC
jgi:hypothetical protein